MTEKELETKLVAGVRQMGGIAFKFVSPGNVGVPDRMVILPGGHILFAELKTNRGRVSRMQQFQIDRLKRLGGKVFLVRGESGLPKFFAICKNLIGGDAE